MKRANLENCKYVATPVEYNSKLSATTGELVTYPYAYWCLTGALQYLTFTRPDISSAIQQICLFMHAPRKPHLTALKRIIQYLQGTMNLNLHLYASTPSQLIAYSYVEWVSCPNTRRSTSGYCVFHGDNLISWSVKHQIDSLLFKYRSRIQGCCKCSCWILLVTTATRTAHSFKESNTSILW